MVNVQITQTKRGSKPRRRACTHAAPRDVEPPRAAAVDGPAARFGKSLAVAIGIDMYGSGIAPLRSAVADADAIAEVLERDHGFETWRLFDDGARLPRLLALLEEDLPAALGPDDRLLLYFAGHGIALDGDAGPAGYLVPAGARISERDGFLPMERLHRALARLPVRHAFVILDCCFAGSFRWSSLRDVDPVATLYRERYDRYLERAAWQVLTSTSSDELALDALAPDALARDRRACSGSHSPFALALLEGLSSAADYTRDNLITADELAIFVRDRVAPTAGSVGRRQVPQLFPLERHDGGQFLFQVPNRTPSLAPAPPLDEDANPYRGLSSYREQDRAQLFGRDEARARLVAAVRAQPLTVVVGPSGSGKSSLVHAGLVPALRADGWKILSTQQPGHRPRSALAALAQELHAVTDPADPAAWAAAITHRASWDPWLVVIDQLEELLGPHVDPGDRAAFLEALARALRGSSSLRLVVVVRSDAEPQVRDSALAAWWGRGRFEVPAMSRDELRQVIERPAAAAVVHFEPADLVERLLDDVALVPAPLPLLSFALSELYRRCWRRWQTGDRDRALCEADYDAMGGVAGALTRRATALHDELVREDPACAATIRNVFLRLAADVSGRLGGRRVPAHELVYISRAENRRVAKVLQRFERARLISRGLEEDERGRRTAYVEPVHDELVLGWELLRRWLRELDAVPGRQAILGALASSVAVWRAHRLDGAYLWNDPRAELAEQLGRDRTFAFNVHEALFVRRSARLRRRSGTRRVRLLLVAICVLAVTSGLAMWQWLAAARAANEQPWCRPVVSDSRPYGTSL
jgi:hypothetical protein